jgi:mannan endo-1,4-beta-mannosidase
MVNFTWDRGRDSPTPRPTNRPFSIRWNGWLLAPRPGNYRLKIFSDDGVRLWLDGRLLVDAWIPQTGREGHDAQVTLTGRPHRLKIEYFDKGSDALLHFLWSQGDAEPTPVPAQALFHSK